MKKIFLLSFLLIILSQTAIMAQSKELCYNKEEKSGNVKRPPDPLEKNIRKKDALMPPDPLEKNVRKKDTQMPDDPFGRNVQNKTLMPEDPLEKNLQKQNKF